MTPKVGLSFVVDPAFTHAVRPLFEDGLVQALEWDVDCMWGLGDGHRAPPAWAEDLLDAYAADGALYGHSVFQSPLGAAWQPRHAAWLDSFAIEVGRRPFRHITEHACFFTGGPFVLGPMLPAPPVDATVALGRERLYAMAAIAKCPIGLENLAGALGTADVVAQGALLDAMVAPIDGVLVLDVHNLYVVATNLGLDPIAVLDHFPLHRVRELHVAGGQRTRPTSGPRTLLLDGHDGPVPEPVFPLVGEVLARCPAVEAVFLERRAQTLDHPDDVEQLRADYRRLVHTVEAFTPLVGSIASPPPPATAPLATGVSRADLDAYQGTLLTLLADAPSAAAVIAALGVTLAPGPLRDYAAGFDGPSVELAAALTRRWGRRDPVRSGHPHSSRPAA
jgi:uncharacterized protein (UPF0276 family)